MSDYFSLDCFSAVGIKPVTFCSQVALKHLGHFAAKLFYSYEFTVHSLTDCNL